LIGAADARNREGRRLSRFYESVAGKKFARVQLLTVEGLLDSSQRAGHPDYEPDLNFKRAKAESDVEQPPLI
jgi:hypothetical protein